MIVLCGSNEYVFVNFKGIVDIFVYEADSKNFSKAS